MNATLAAGKSGDTIFALASGSGRGAISVLRLSGAASRTLLERLCGTLPPARQATLRGLRDASGGLLDRGLVLWMPGPASYTGEDTAELHLHGGRAVLAAVTAALLRAGAAPPTPANSPAAPSSPARWICWRRRRSPTWSQRKRESQRLQALRQLQGTQSALLAGWAERLQRSLAFQEALIDFPDEDLPEDVERGLVADLNGLTAEIDAHIRRPSAARNCAMGWCLPSSVRPMSANPRC